MTKLFVHIVTILIMSVLCLPAVPSADQAQYFYDELGRLVAVVDRTGNAAMFVESWIVPMVQPDNSAAMETVVLREAR